MRSPRPLRPRPPATDKDLWPRRFRCGPRPWNAARPPTRPVRLPGRDVTKGCSARDLARAAQNGAGPLAEELARTLQDIQVGRSRRQAFEALTARTTVVDLRRFVRAVIQADAYGISIADV